MRFPSILNLQPNRAPEIDSESIIKTFGKLDSPLKILIYSKKEIISAPDAAHKFAASSHRCSRNQSARCRSISFVPIVSGAFVNSLEKTVELPINRNISAKITAAKHRIFYAIKEFSNQRPRQMQCCRAAIVRLFEQTTIRFCTSRKLCLFRCNRNTS